MLPRQTQNDGPSQEQIAARAFEIYNREGQIDGRHIDHWLQAEQELKREENTARMDNPQPPSKATRTDPQAAKITQGNGSSQNRTAPPQAQISSNLDTANRKNRNQGRPAGSKAVPA